MAYCAEIAPTQQTGKSEVIPFHSCCQEVLNRAQDRIYVQHRQAEDALRKARWYETDTKMRMAGRIEALNTIRSSLLHLTWDLRKSKRVQEKQKHLIDL